MEEETPVGSKRDQDYHGGSKCLTDAWFLQAMRYKYQIRGYETSSATKGRNLQKWVRQKLIEMLDVHQRTLSLVAWVLVVKISLWHEQPDKSSSLDRM